MMSHNVSLFFALLFVIFSGGNAMSGSYTRDTGTVTPTPAGPLNIILTNDDGFETKFIQSLFKALVNAGHNVVMSAPYSGQSGTSGSIAFLQPITPTTEDSPQGNITAGSPGVGPTGMMENQYYVDGRPAAAVLYGIDILAPKIFGGKPDLVISGPNEGNNIGLLTSHSGTVGATVTALNKGIPSIAVSGPSDHETADAALIAALTLKVVEKLNTAEGINLPRGIGLNVNVGDTVLPSVEDYKFKMTTLGVAATYGLKFVENIGEDPIAVAFGVPAGTAFPAVTVSVPYTGAGYPLDNSTRSEGNVFEDGIVTISPIEGLYRADSTLNEAVGTSLGSLVM